MPRKPKAVPLSKVNDIQSSLKHKAATPKTISLEELILTLAQPIQDMLSAGYDYSDVAEVFQGHGVELAASGIKSFHKKALTTGANTSGDNSLGSSSELNSQSFDQSTSQEIDDGSSSSLPYTSEQSDNSTNKTTKVKKARAKEPSHKSKPTSQPNSYAFVPKIYSDDEL